MVIAAVGKNGSGKDFFLEYLRDKYNLPMTSIGDIVRELAEKDGLEKTRENLHATSKKYMDQNGTDFFPKQVEKKIRESGAPVYLVSGIRPYSDVLFFHESFGDDFILVDVVVSDDAVRYGRMLARGSARDGSSEENLRAFDAAEEAQFKTSESEKLADVIIKNDGSKDDFYQAIEDFYAVTVAQGG
ncbi:MAG: AAA family ATPase [Oscillospiraceae bacterium]|jgi:dephospho-CoA kinase|nr:AAA family ATPase [Oscillospiraceae bacterium]